MVPVWSPDRAVSSMIVEVRPKDPAERPRLIFFQKFINFRTYTNYSLYWFSYKYSFSLLLSTLVFHGLIFSQTDIRYDPWDWITYKNVSQVYSITEGREYIYFATNGGIIRYHLYGKYWGDPITRSQGLPSDDVRSIYFDFNTNILWAADKNHLSYSTNDGGSWDTVDPVVLGLRPSEYIVRIGSTPGNLWCITTSQVLQLNSMSGFVINPYATIPEDNVNWGSSLITYPNTKESTEILVKFTLTNGWIKSSNILLGPHFEEVTLSTIFLDRFGDVWVGTWGGPVFYGSYQMRILEPIYFGPAQTSAEVVLPGDGYLWIGGITHESQFSGLTKLDIVRGYWDKFRSGYEIFFGGDNIFCGVQLRGEWWFGTPEGIQIYDEKQDSWFLLTEAKGFPDQRVTSMASDGEYLYAGTPFGIIRFSAKDKIRVPWELSDQLLGQMIYDMHWDGKDLWISAELGLWLWESFSDSYRYYSWVVQKGSEDFKTKDNSSVGLISPLKAIASTDQKVYFGDNFGILIFNKKDENWERITGASQLIGLQILDLHISDDIEEKNKILWVGSTQGVIKINLESGIVRKFTKRDGLPSNFIQKIFVDMENAWFGTPEGLVWFNWTKYE